MYGPSTYRLNWFQWEFRSVNVFCKPLAGRWMLSQPGEAKRAVPALCPRFGVGWNMQLHTKTEFGPWKWRQSTCSCPWIAPASMNASLGGRRKGRSRNVAHADNTGSDRLFPQTWVGLLHGNWSWNQGSVSQLSHESKLKYLISWQRYVNASSVRGDKQLKEDSFCAPSSWAFPFEHAWCFKPGLVIFFIPFNPALC